jgi:hypothetical protein
MASAIPPFSSRASVQHASGSLPNLSGRRHLSAFIGYPLPEHRPMGSPVPSPSPAHTRLVHYGIHSHLGVTRPNFLQWVEILMLIYGGLWCIGAMSS